MHEFQEFCESLGLDNIGVSLSIIGEVMETAMQNDVVLEEAVGIRESLYENVAGIITGSEESTSIKWVKLLFLICAILDLSVTIIKLLTSLNMYCATGSTEEKSMSPTAFLLFMIQFLHNEISQVDKTGTSKMHLLLPEFMRLNGWGVNTSQQVN